MLSLTEKAISACRDVISARQDALHLTFAACVALNLAPELRNSVQECWLF